MRIIATLASLFSRAFRPVRTGYVNGVDALIRHAVFTAHASTAILGYRRNGSPIYSIGGGAQMHMALVDSVMCQMVLVPLLYNNTDDPISHFVDTRDYSFVEFHILIGATDVIVDAAAYEDTTLAGTAAPTAVTGASIVQVSATGDNVMVVISIAKQALTKRYVGINIVVGNSTGANVAIECFRWGKAGMLPETQAVAGTSIRGTTQVIRVS